MKTHLFEEYLKMNPGLAANEEAKQAFKRVLQGSPLGDEVLTEGINQKFVPGQLMDLMLKKGMNTSPINDVLAKSSRVAPPVSRLRSIPVKQPDLEIGSNDEPELKRRPWASGAHRPPHSRMDRGVSSATAPRTLGSQGKTSMPPPKTGLQPNKTQGSEVDGEEKKGFGDRFKSWFSKGKEESSDSESDDKKTLGASFWATLVLILVIVLISIGAYFKLNQPKTVSFNYGSGSDSGEGSSMASGQTESCLLASGTEGVSRYVVTPRPEYSGRHGFENEALTVESLQTPQFSSEKNYYAIKVGSNFLVAVEESVAVFMPVSAFFDNPASECVESAGTGVLTRQAQESPSSSVELAYRIDVSHWSGWLVLIALIATLCFALISLSLTGNSLWDLFMILMAILTAIMVVKGISTIISYLPTDVVPKISVTIFMVFAGFFVNQFFWSSESGSKSETRQFSEEFEAGSQFKVPDSFKPVFESLSRGWGLLGGFDWSVAIIYTAVFMVVGAIDLNASPAYMMFRNQIAAIVLQALIIMLLSGFETYRRGVKEDWFSFGVGFVGLVDLPLLIWLFGENPPDVAGMTSTALALGLSLLFFIVVFGANFWFQTRGDRMELLRDRMADGMLFYSAMKLSAILLYIFLFMM